MRLSHLTACQMCDCVQSRDNLSHSCCCVEQTSIVLLARHAVVSCFFCPLLECFLFGSGPIYGNEGAECDIGLSQVHRRKLAVPKTYSLFCGNNVITLCVVSCFHSYRTFRNLCRQRSGLQYRSTRRNNGRTSNVRPLYIQLVS